jgi:hypothetical protein
LKGPPDDLLLLLFGRRAVEIISSPEAIEVVQRTSAGM